MPPEPTTGAAVVAPLRCLPLLVPVPRSATVLLVFVLVLVWHGLAPAEVVWLLTSIGCADVLLTRGRRRG
ncbi:hypothetical protein [Actinophytocola algeriensis]|uniref:Uncharacterized protein n=1 Tax=Actinophytocola algeriensis TaxID=1768010 RepID=A0A7W7Q6M9_9PSEU|nr:hypothetical protein [Actinophytocola algeriensis]MBB4907808.1 hypothetical protein [Actinophytocola algeriensis]MBE1479838.1 hypothetical protein [Actinophytocola algeriensis]